jgi:hypothetical protein
MGQVAVERPEVGRAIIARPAAERPIAPRPVFAEAACSLWSPQVAIGTIPPQPPQRKPGARLFGTCALVAGLAALGAAGIYRLIEKPRRTVPEEQEEPVHVSAARYLNGAAAVLSFSVLTDSGLEHFRGAFHNPAMYLAPTVAATTFVNSLHMTATPAQFGHARWLLAGLALTTGLAGFGFHTYNLTKREGGINLLNLFYGAPLGAPWAITLSGLAGMAASRLVAEGEQKEPGRLLGLPAGRFLTWGTAVGLAGTVAEAALLHFRGAFHDPFMFLPVSVPPMTAIAVAAAAIKPELIGWAKPMLQATAAMGVAGAGFHAYGVSRNMGGFYNWSQNLLNGPPLLAPPSFTGVALAGLGAIKLMEAQQ